MGLANRYKQMTTWIQETLTGDKTPRDFSFNLSAGVKKKKHAS